MMADDTRSPDIILEEIYKKAVYNAKNNKIPSTKNFEIEMQIQTLVKKSTELKAVVTVLITSLVKKIEDPNQDIRLHKIEFEGGYSGRSYDTHYITPFLKKHIPRIAMKESGWLTRSIEQPHPFDRGFPGKIRSKNVKDAFLSLIEKVENGEVEPDLLLEILLTKLVSDFNKGNQNIKSKEIVDKKALILEIIRVLNEHFECKRSSILPVIAIYSMYQVVIKQISRYKGKELLPLKSHTTADIKSDSLGDIEIKNADGHIFEATEVKYNIKIDEYIILDVINKISGRGVNRYYILTTAFPEIKDGEENKVKEMIKSFKQNDGCEIVINGVLPTIKYYLRLIEDLEEFISTYTQNLEKIYQESSFVSEEHINVWFDLLNSL
jgi:DNA (cytosine-5)-methyltransferase 1